MPKYNVTLVTPATTVVTVDVPLGASPEAIVQAALEADTPGLCHQCTGGLNGAPELILGDEWAIPDGGSVSDYISEIEG